MRVCRLIVLVGLAVLVAVPGVEAGVILRTAAFPSYGVISGDVSCAVTNTGSVSGNVSIALYDYFRAVVATYGLAPLAPNATAFTGTGLSHTRCPGPL